MAETLFRCDTGDFEIPVGCTLIDYVLKNALHYGDKIAIESSENGLSYTYNELYNLIHNVAVNLSKLTIKKGDVVMLLLPNIPEYPILFLGIIKTGSIVTTCNPNCTVEELSKQLLDSKTKMIITMDALWDKVGNFEIPKILVGNGRPGSLLLTDLFQTRPAGSESKFPCDPDSVCALPYSSGTTGIAKGVMLTQQNLVSNLHQQIGGEYPRFDICSGDILLGLLPMFHIYSITAVMLFGICMGAKIITVLRFDLHRLIDLIQKSKITIAHLVPPIILAFNKFPELKAKRFASLRFVVSGAAPLGREVETEFQSKFPHITLGQGYGMTETSPVVSLSKNFWAAKKKLNLNLSSKKGSAGSLVPHTVAKIVDTDTGMSLKKNERGELCIKGPQVMKGYLNQPEITRSMIDDQGFLHTGDVAYVDEEGEIFIVDRVKELIKFKGFQVPPAELETILLSHPEIKDSAVVSQPDEVSGELPVAFVVLQMNSKISQAGIMDFVNEKVSSYKRLHNVVFVDTIPKSASGKILRRELRSRF